MSKVQQYRSTHIARDATEMRLNKFVRFSRILMVVSRGWPRTRNRVPGLSEAFTAQLRLISEHRRFAFKSSDKGSRQ
jgi:hypothetical protein